jgi:hypothetical protein
MSKADEILRIDKPHFTIRVYEDMLRVDIKGSLREDIVEAFENKPVLKQTIGSILEMFAPLHVRLSDIDSASTDEKGKVKIKLPRHRDLTIPLEPKDGKRLVYKLDELIPKAKERELDRLMKDHKLERIVQAKKLQKIEKTERERAKEELVLPTGGTEFPFPAPRSVLREEKEAEEEEQEK